MGVAEEAVVNVEAEFTANGDALNWRSRRKQDGDQNEVLLALVKGKPLTPRDAENELGINRVMAGWYSSSTRPKVGCTLDVMQGRRQLSGSQMKI